MMIRYVVMGAATLWLVGCNDKGPSQPQPTEPLASLIAPSTASKLADKPELERRYRQAATYMDRKFFTNVYELLKPYEGKLPAEMEYFYRLAQAGLYGRTSTDVLEGVKGLYELAEQGYPYPLLNYSNNNDLGGKERVPYMIPDPSMCELPRYQKACAQYPVAQVKWQAYVNWARETGDPWAYWNQWHLYAQESAFEAQGLAVLKEGVTKGCRLCAAGVAEHYLEQLATHPDSAEQAQWQQMASDYLAIARQGTLACEPGTELLILDKANKSSDSIIFQRVIAQMAPMSAQEQRDFYQACLKLGSRSNLFDAAMTFATNGVGPEYDAMLAAATMFAIYDATTLHREISDESIVAFRLALATTRFKDGEDGQDADIDQITDKVLKDKPLITKIMKQAKEIQKQFPYWGVRNYNNPAIQTINQRFYTLDEMRDAGIHFSFDPPKEQADN
ncbi:hypothetical protein [Aeromonas salmonicida]|uniref:hypothetical protein n=1 Tax=Aeromonas salmonicida TaxID=645 RepID=UPI0038B85E32